jgi:hypothetical protein
VRVGPIIYKSEGMIRKNALLVTSRSRRWAWHGICCSCRLGGVFPVQPYYREGDDAPCRET